MTSLFVCTPCYDNKMMGQTASSVIDLCAMFPLDIPVHLEIPTQGSDISRIRDNCAAKFMTTDATHLMFIDADIVFDSRDVVRLLSHDVPLVGGTYPKKEINEKRILEAVAAGDPNWWSRGLSWAHRFHKDTEILPNGIAEVGFLPAGFLLIRRDAFEAVEFRFPELEYINHEMGRPVRSFKYFKKELITENGETFDAGEDFCFTKRVRDAGLKAYVDLEIRLGHVGTFVYSGEPKVSCGV